MKSLPEVIRPASYQLLPLAKILANRLSGILIADGVGVGKTISAGYIIAYARTKLAKPAIVVCSPTLIPKWVLEMKSKFSTTSLPVRSIEDLETARDESVHRPEGNRQPVYVMSNSLLSKAEREDYPRCSAVVFDEIHTYRNPKTEWQKGCLEVANASDLRVGLSATPINNQLEDIVSELNILLPEHDHETISAVVNDLWNTDRQALTGALVTRFLKDRLGIHFAKRIVETVSVSYPESYVREVPSAINEKMPGGNLLEEITYYRLAASSPWAFWTSLGMKQLRERWDDPKFQALVKIINDNKADVSHWLVFCEFTETVEFLSRRIEHPYVYTMTGDTPMFDRESITSSFRDGPKGLLIVTSVGSEGLDFQFCGGIVNYDLHWNPMKLEQRAGRIDRVGQERKTIKIINIEVADSVDERVLSVIKRKLDLISNSVFAPSPILSETPGKSKRRGIYNEDAIAHELDAGTSLIEAFKLNGKLESEDYTALAFVETELCQPAVLEQAAPLIGPETIVRDEHWLKSITEKSNSVIELIHDYS